MVMDKLFARELLARQLESITGRECKVLGTTSLKNVNGINKTPRKRL